MYAVTLVTLCAFCGSARAQPGEANDTTAPTPEAQDVDAAAEPASTTDAARETQPAPAPDASELEPATPALAQPDAADARADVTDATLAAPEPPRPGQFPPGGIPGWWNNTRTHDPRPIAASAWVRGTCVDCRVPFTGDRFRARGPRAWFKRTAADWLAMPSTVMTWGAPGWLTFSGIAAATIVPMLPLGPSLDVRAQNWLNDRKNDRTEKAFLHVTTKQIVSGVIMWEALILGAGWASGNERLLEFGGLTVETIADVQFYHLLAKMLLGREGPKSEGGQGKVHGPTEVFFPAGTPSGHTATIYALLTVSAEYADSWALRVFSHLAAAYFGASLIYQNAHYFSDVIWGAAMGYYMGRWVMRYRSSRYRCDDARERPLRERITFMPVMHRNGFALGASMSL